MHFVEFLNIFDQPVLTLGLSAFLALLIALPFSLWALGSEKSSSLVRFLIAVSNLLLSFQLVFRWWESGHFPISNLYESLCFLAWACTISQLIIERSWDSPLLQAFTTPLALVAISFASFVLPEQLQKASPLVPALRSSWLVMHVSVIMLSYAALLIGSLLSLGVLVINNDMDLQIRNSSIGSGGFRKLGTSLLLDKEDKEFRMNPLSLTSIEQLDNLSYRTISFGFLLLTIGLISGAVWANQAWGSWWSWDPKETWAFISWLVYAAYLHMRISKGWQGRRPATMAVFGSFIIAICYIGVNLLGVGLHSYGWFF